MAHIIPIRRCNLSCTYCNEYDDFSKPVASEIMTERLDQLADLGTTIVTFSGGEPLLHPELDRLIAHVRSRGMIAGMITNGYLLTRAARAAIERRRPGSHADQHRQRHAGRRVEEEPEGAGQEAADPGRARALSREHQFGAGRRHSQSEDALVVGKRALELGFTSTVGIIHDGDGQLRPIGERERKVFLAMKQFEKKNFSQINYFQDNIAHGKPSDWRCRAGSRYLYICEDGLVHYCSQQRGYPAKPLAEYTVADIRREYLTEKSCAPFCTVSCVHQISYIDFWRDPQTIPSTVPEALNRWCRSNRTAADLLTFQAIGRLSLRSCKNSTSMPDWQEKRLPHVVAQRFAYRWSSTSAC